MNNIKSRNLILIVGYSGAGKTTIATKICQKYNLPLLSEDNFVFKMHPHTMITRVADGEARRFGMQNLFSVLENYMATDRSIVVEGALVDGPATLVDFQALAKAHHYNFVPIMLTAESKQRRKRKKRKKGYVIPRKLDNRLIRAAESLKYNETCTIVDNTKLSEKKTLAAIEEIIRHRSSTD